MTYLEFRGALLDAYRIALAQAVPPKPQVARHWESAGSLTWLGLVPEQAAFHLAFSFGQLKGTPLVPGEPHTAGVFRLAGSVFKGVDHERLARELHALVPASADGATRAFLQRVVAQVSCAEVALTLEQAPSLLPMAVSTGFTVAVPARPDALGEAAATPRMPPHAVERVSSALREMDEVLRARILQLFDAPETTLSAAVRGASGPWS